MKKGIKITIAAVAVVLVAGAGLSVASHASGGYGYAKEHGWRHGGGFSRGIALFERLDGDKNGTVTQAEITKARGDQLAKFDTDGNGKLALKEFQALWLERMHPRMVDQFQRLDNDGDAIVTGEEFNRPLTFMMRRLDRNNDGQITKNEIRSRRYKSHRRSHHDKDDDD